MPSNNKITVITKFNANQVGYLDFYYRIAALEKAGMLDVVISNIPLARQELKVSEQNFVLIPGATGGNVSKWKFYYNVKKYCEINKKDRVLLLHSSLAPLAKILNKCKIFLYWNEHPSHFIGIERQKYGFISKLKQFYLLKKFYGGACNADVVMPIGEHHLSDLLNAGCMQDKLHMVHMGVSETFRLLTKKEESETLRLVYTGSVMKDRGRDIMLEAVSIIKSKGYLVELTIVGASNDEKAICNDVCKELKISDRVNIVGRVPGTEIPDYINNADIGICIWADKPYWRFNPPTKLFEYMVAGLPVLANNMVTHTEYIKDGINGLICEYDAESFADTVIKCFEEKGLLKKMTGYVIKNSDQFLWSNIEQDFIDLMRT